MKRFIGTPFHFIGGISKTRTPGPSAFHRVQTDGSYSYRKGCQGRVAAILYTPDHKKGPCALSNIKAGSSTETEWASIYMGLLLALEHNKTTLGIENDNLGVVRSLTFNESFFGKHEYSRYYFHEIMKLTDATEWTGIRWIPRELNRADDLFH